MEYGVSRTTARRALVLLEDGGLIQGTAGRVRFVCSPADSARPALARFEQIATDLRTEIESGQVRSGQRLGTEATLAARFNVSPGTARRALQELAEEGAVIGISGRGWFVASTDGAPTRAAETVSAIRAGITSGEWPVGSKLPGELALATRFGVGRITVRRALAQLEVEGILEKDSSRGRLVRRTTIE